MACLVFLSLKDVDKHAPLCTKRFRAKNSPWIIIYLDCDSSQLSLPKPYWEKYDSYVCQYNISFCLNMIFSKILLKVDNKDTGLQLIASFSSPLINFLDNLTFEGYFHNVTEILNILRK